MSFKTLNLCPEVNQAIELCGYTTPTPIQSKAIPPILEGKDVVASAQTGTGKTAAFVLPALDLLSKMEPAKKTRILILTPTRELANQITKAAAQYGKFLKFNIVNLVGGMPYHQQIRELTRGADIVVATPGRLLDHIEKKRVNLSSIKMLVLDEADRMLDMGFIEDVEYIAKLTPENRQTLMFSATVDKQLTTVVRHLLKHPVRIDLSSESVTVPNIEQHFYKTTSPHHKSRLLTHFLNEGNIYKAIIFTATKIYADKIADQLSDEGFSAAALHGDLRQNVRNRVIDQLRQGRVQYLVATDVAARGIDISDISHVFNYDLPRSSEDYVHRIGRTGRAGKSGIAISFISPTDVKHIQRIERFIGERIKLITNLDVGQNEKHPKEAYQEDTSRSVKKEYQPKINYGKSSRPDHKFAKAGFKSRTESAGFGEKRFGKKRSTPFAGRDDAGDQGSRPFQKRSVEGAPHKRRFDEDKPERSFSSDRARPASRGRFDDDKPKRSFSGDRARPAGRGRFDDDKPKRSFSSDRERPASRGRFDDDKPKRSFSGDRARPASRGRFDDDKPKRSFSGDRAKPASRGRFDDDKPKRSFSGDRARPASRGRFDDDKPKRSFSGDRARPASKGRFEDDKPKRSFSSDRARPASKGRFDVDKPRRSDTTAGNRPLRKQDTGKSRFAGNKKPVTKRRDREESVE